MTEMLAGLLLGPSCLGWLTPQFSAQLFPASSIPTLSFVSQAGLIVFMFLIGWRIDIAHLAGTGRAVVITSIVSVLVPFALGAFLATILWEEHAPTGVTLTPFALFMGTAMSITAFPVLVRILDDHDLLPTTLGTLAVAWRGVQCRGGLGDFRHRHRHYVAAYVTDRLVLHALFGAFLSGALMPRSTDRPRAFVLRVEPAVTRWLPPLFFASSGLRTSPPMLNST